MKKKKFQKLSANEWLGDTATHFLKSGSAFRSEANDQLKQLSALIPKKSPTGLNVEYDITYDFSDKIHGFKFTDCLTKMVYLAPCGQKFSVDIIKNAAIKGATKEGWEVFEKLRSSVQDKYTLEEADVRADTIILLPGTNLLTIDDYIDFEKIDKLVAEGAKVKLHPITAKVWQTMLHRRWGKAVVDKDASAYALIKQAKKCYFTMSSETGMACTLLGVDVGLIQRPDTKKQSTFEAIYRGLDKAGRDIKLREKFVSLLSHPESGLLTVFHENPEERIQRFFSHCQQTYPLKQVSV